MRRQLTLFAAALALPILGFVAYVLASLAFAERERLENDAISAARTMAQAVDRDVFSIMSALRVLAISPELAAGDLEAFHRNALPLADLLGVTTILRDLDGQQLVDTTVPWGSELPLDAGSRDVAAMEATGPQIVDLYQNPVTGAFNFAVETPAPLGEAAPDYLLALAMDVDRVRRILVNADLPSEWTVEVIDNGDRILAREPRHGDYVGRVTTDDIKANIQGWGGHWETHTRDGEPIFAAYARSPLTDWRVVIGVREELLNAPVRQSVRFLALIGFATLLLALLAASVFARRISRSVASLDDQARQLARGEPVDPHEFEVEDFNPVGSRLVEASRALRGREAELRASEARFRAIADTMPQMVWSATPDGLHDYYNARWYEFTGMEEGSTDGEAWNEMFHPDDRERAWASWRQSLATGAPYEIEYRLRHHSGQYRWALGLALPVRDDAGRITRWFGTCTDIHESRMMAQEREVIAQELNHRIKNIFAVLGSIISLTARSHPGSGELADELRARVFALGAAHDFVRPQGHSSSETEPDRQATLHGLMRTLLAAYDDDGTRIAISGTDARIDEGAATPLALVFHELATNAAKYGGLSETGGGLTITCRDDGDDYIVSWREKGAPAAQSSGSGSGFGSRLIDLSVRGQMGGSVETVDGSDGFAVDIRFPRWALTRSAKLRRNAETASAGRA